MNIIDKTEKYRGKWHQRDLTDIRFITIHHTAIPSSKTKEDSEVLSKIEKQHKARGWSGVSLHYLITKTGNVYQLNNPTDTVWHDRVNRDSIGIAIDGYFHEPHNEFPNREQLKTLKNLLYKLRKDFGIPPKNVIPHKDRSYTGCPGDILNKYIQEYQKEGNSVSWGHIDDKMQKMGLFFNPKDKIPQEWIELLNLDQKEWFNNKWSFEKLIGKITDWYETIISQNKIIENKEKEIELLKENNLAIQKHITTLQSIVEDKNKVIKTKNQSITAFEKQLSEKTPFKLLMRIFVKKVIFFVRKLGARSGI